MMKNHEMKIVKEFGGRYFYINGRKRLYQSSDNSIWINKGSGTWAWELIENVVVLTAEYNKKP